MLVGASLGEKTLELFSSIEEQKQKEFSILSCFDIVDQVHAHGCRYFLNLEGKISYINIEFL